MIEEILKCDQCKKTSSDICGDEGWIEIRSLSSMTFSIADKRDDKGCHHGKVYKLLNNKTNFCSLECMLKFMEIKIPNIVITIYSNTHKTRR